jgi:hypothetical protein
VKAILLKTLVVCIAAGVCGAIAGVLFSVFFYNFVPRSMLTEVYLSDTHAKMKLRFWIAFGVGAVFGIVWSYRIVKDLDLWPHSPPED